jgi:nudix-type nucleoside diphosphatase (YffH/AdpP family)
MALNPKIRAYIKQSSLLENTTRLWREYKSSTKRVDIISKQKIFQKSIFQIEEVHLRHERFDGSMSHEFIRLNLDRGDSVAALLHDEEADTVILIEQFRYPAYEKGPGWLIELPAGIVDQTDVTPKIALQREVMEEIGYSIQSFHHISTFYPSPGGSSERIALYYASITPKDCVAKGGGLIESDEDIRRFSLTVDDALLKIATGEIVDAKTIIGLQWLQLHRSTHQ